MIDLNLYRRLLPGEKQQASRYYVSLIHDDYLEKQKKKIENSKNNKNNKKKKKMNSTPNVKYTFQKELDEFLAVFPNLVRIAALTENMKIMSEEHKKRARAQKLILRKDNADISDKQFEKYFLNYHRVFDGKVHRLINNEVKTTKKGRKKTQSQKYASILTEVDEKDLLLMVSVENSFDILCSILDDENLVTSRTIAGRPLCALVESLKLYYGITIPMCDLFVDAIVRACLRFNNSSESSSSGGSNESNEESGEDEDMDDRSGRKDSFIGEENVENLVESIVEEKKTPAELPLKTEVEKKTDVQEKNQIVVHKSTDPPSIQGSKPTSEIVAVVQEENCSSGSTDEVISNCFQTSVLPLPSQESPFVDLMKEPFMSPDAEVSNMKFVERDTIEDTFPSVQNSLNYIPNVASNIVEMEEEDNDVEKVKRDQYEDLVKFLHYPESEQVVAKTQVNSDMMKGDSQQKHFSHIMINVLTYYMKDWGTSKHVLFVYDLFTSFLVCRSMNYPYDCAEVSEHLSQIFGDFGYPLTVCYYRNGMCFTDLRYENVSGKKNDFSDGFKYDWKQPFGSDQYALVENDVTERVMRVHDTIFKGCVYDITRSIICNVLHPIELEDEMKERMKAFVKRVKFYVNRHENEAPVLRSSKNSMEIQYSYPQAQHWLNTEGFIYQGPIEQCKLTVPYEKRSAFEKQFGRCAFYNEMDPTIVACTNFYTDVWSPDNPPLGFTKSREEAGVSSKCFEFYSSESLMKYGYPPCLSPYGMSPNICRLLLDQGTVGTSVLEKLNRIANAMKFPVGIQNKDNKCAFNSVFRFLQDMPLHNDVVNNMVKELATAQMSKTTLTFPLLWSYVLCGRMLYNTNRAVLVPIKNGERFIDIEPFVECLFRRMEMDVDVEENVDDFVDRRGNEDVSNLFNKFFDICSTDVHKQNKTLGKYMVSLFKPSSKYVLNCTSCNEVWERKLSDSEGTWALELSVREKLPMHVNNLIMKAADIGDCIIHLEDLIRIESSCWNEVMDGCRCRLGEKRFKNDKSLECYCAVKKKTVYEGTSPYLIVDLKRYTRTNDISGTYVAKILKVKVFIPKELNFELKSGMDTSSMKYYLTSAIAHEGKSLNSGHYVVLKELPGSRFLRISDKVTTEMSEAEYQQKLFQDGTLFLFKRHDVDVVDEDEAAMFHEYEFTPDVMNYKNEIEQMAKKRTSVPNNEREGNVPSPILKTGKFKRVTVVMNNGNHHPTSFGSTSVTKVYLKSKEKGQVTDKKIQSTIRSITEVESTNKPTTSALKSQRKGQAVDQLVQSKIGLNTTLTKSNTKKRVSASSIKKRDSTNVNVPHETKRQKVFKEKEECTIVNPDVMNPRSVLREKPDERIGYWDIDGDRIKLPTNVGLIDYFPYEQARPRQPCIYCGEYTHLKFGKVTYICGKCASTKNSENTVVTREFLNKKHKAFKVLDEDESYCFGCGRQLLLGKQDSYFHPLGEFKFCRRCVIHGKCKCFMCGPKESYTFTKNASILKEKHIITWQKWIDGLDKKMFENHKQIMKNGINKHVTQELDPLEKDLLTEAIAHDKEFITACDYSVLRTTDFQNVVFKDGAQDDPMTQHFMKFYVKLCQNVAMSLTNDVTVDYDNNDPSVLLKIGLEKMRTDERKIYVGIDDKVWFAYEISFPKQKKTTIRITYFGRRYDDFALKMTNVVDDFYINRDGKKDVLTSVNHAIHFGSNCKEASRTKTRNQWGSVYCIYFIINRLAGMDVAVHDLTMEKLRKHLCVAILTGEPLYYLEHGIGIEEEESNVTPH